MFKSFKPFNRVAPFKSFADKPRFKFLKVFGQFKTFKQISGILELTERC
jgi:hypothetical protein